MKKIALSIIAVALLTFCFALTSEAGNWYATYLAVSGYNSDDSRVTDRYSWNGYTHLAITWNDTVYTASGIEMDPNGVPLVYYWADIYPSYYDLYYSYDGYYWYYYGHYIYY